VKVREIVDDELDEVGKTYDIEEPVERAELLALLDGSELFTGWATKEWRLGIEEIAAGTNVRENIEQIGQRSPVPVTRLRQFYRLLRAFPGREVAEELLKASVDQRGRQLTETFVASYAHLLHYNNEAEDFGDREDQRQGEPTHSGFAANLVRQLMHVEPDTGKRKPWIPKQTSELACEYVTREINPLRTRGAMFDDHRSARSSGGGGIDVLLRSIDGQFPIVGELKAKTDTNLFVALVQALTYASELATPSQRRRLARYGFLPSLATTSAPFLRLYLMYEETADDRKMFAQTVQLAEAMLSRGDGIRRWIDRIVFLSFASPKLDDCTNVVSLSV
jgi:hypothetical protein